MGNILNKIKEIAAKRKAANLARANEELGWRMASANNAIEEYMQNYSLGPVRLEEEVPQLTYSPYVEEVDPDDYMSVTDARRAAASRKAAAQSQQQAGNKQPTNKEDKQAAKQAYLSNLRAGYTKAAANAGLNDAESITRMQQLLKDQGYYDKVNANKNQNKVDGLWGKKSQEAYALYLKDQKNNQSEEQKLKPASEVVPKRDSISAIINSESVAPITLATQQFAHNPYGFDYINILRAARRSPQTSTAIAAEPQAVNNNTPTSEVAQPKNRFGAPYQTLINGAKLYMDDDLNVYVQQPNDSNFVQLPPQSVALTPRMPDTYYPYQAEVRKRRGNN